MKLVKVEWWDHACWADGSRWRAKEQSINDLTPVLVTTVGFILKTTKKYLVLCSTLSDDQATKHEFVILRGAIKKVKKL